MQSPSLDAVARNLIERLKKAVVGSREFDLEIAVAVRALPESLGSYTSAAWSPMGDEIVLHDVDSERHGVCDPQLIRRYTTSLDAAMSLIGRGFNDRAGLMLVAKDKWTASVQIDGHGGVANASTPALALCIAALRARVSSVSHPSMAGES